MHTRGRDELDVMSKRKLALNKFKSATRVIVRENRSSPRSPDRNSPLTPDRNPFGDNTGAKE